MFQAKTEVNTLVFARVFKVVLDATTAKDGPEGKAYDHYYGFAQVEKHSAHSGKTVFFKRATHLSRKDGFFFGSVPHRPGYTVEGDITHSGDVVVGHVREDPEGAGLRLVDAPCASLPPLQVVAPQPVENDQRGANLLHAPPPRRARGQRRFVLDGSGADETGR